jgi:hypothetical protein
MSAALNHAIRLARKGDQGAADELRRLDSLAESRRVALLQEMQLAKALQDERDALLEALEVAPATEHALPFGAVCNCGQCQFVRLRRAALAKSPKKPSAQPAPDLSKFKPENQQQMREWIADGSFVQRALDSMFSLSEEVTSLKNSLAAANQTNPKALPFGVGGGLQAIKTLLGRDPCAHANTAIAMIDEIIKAAGAQAKPSLESVDLEPVEGDLLPAIGSRVFILHARDNLAHACTVKGFYAWGDLSGSRNLQRVFVRLVYEGTTTPQARMLSGCWPTEVEALAAKGGAA